MIVDEAHRTQYQSLAENLRGGLPKAQYIAFTGTPLLGNARKTNAWASIMTPAIRRRRLRSQAILA